MAKKIFFGSFLTVFICFLVLYIVGMTGYFDYKQHEKMVITKENMEKFESDVKEGKDIDMTDYMLEEEYDYNNSVSRMGMDLSNNIEKYTKMILGGVFKAIDKAVK